MECDGTGHSAFSPARSRLGWFWPVVALALYLSFPYYSSLHTFFSHDDFAILHFHKDWSIWKPWLYLRPDVLTFYRPMQSYSLALLYQMFGLEPFPYGAVLIAIHLASIVLFGRLVERLFRDRVLTFLSVIFFAANWEYCDVVFWKANYGTALSWLFTFGACNLFADYLAGKKLSRCLAAGGLTIAALLSKESAVNVPLLLTLILWIRRAQGGSQFPSAAGSLSECVEPTGTRMTWVDEVRSGLRLLAPFYGIVVAYLIFHKLLVRDAYWWIEKGYEYAPPLGWISSIARGLTFWLTASLEAAAPILAPAPERPGVLLWFDGHAYVIPAVLVAAVAIWRDQRLVFSILWAIVAFLPANLIGDPHTPRYYYGAASGAALIYAVVFVAADQAILRRFATSVLAVARAVGLVLILAFVYTNLHLTEILVNQDARKCRDIEDTYLFLRNMRNHVKPKTLFLVYCLNAADHFHEGFGLREMFKLALDDESVEAIFPDQRLSTHTLDILNRDYRQRVSKMIRIRSGGFLLLDANSPTTSPASVAPPPTASPATATSPSR